MTDRPDPSELARMLDEAAITRLIHRFSACLDGRDFEGYGETFTEDGVFEIFGQRRSGRAEIADGARELGRFALTQHYNTNIVVDVDGDQASASSSLLAIHLPDRDDPTAHADVGAVYRYRCARTVDGWRFRRVRVEVTWTAGISLLAALGR